MNREIKFRGKRVDSGKWVYGYYFKTPLTDEVTNSKPEDGWYFLSGRERHCIAQNSCVYEVIPETVGQYTGLKDKNGKEIFEGDIIRVTCTYNSDVGDFFITNIAYDFCWNNGFSAEPIRGYPCITHMAEKDLSNIEVIGNIYENPELLEKIE